MLWGRVCPDRWAARPYYRQFVRRWPDGSTARRGGSGIARLWQSDRISTDCDGQRQSWIWGRAVESMSCFRQDVLGPPARSMGWT